MLDAVNWAKTLWQRKRIWIIILGAQIVLNMLGLLLPDGFQVVLMATSGAVLLAFSVYAVYSQRSNMLSMLLNILLLYFNYSLVAAVYWNTGGLEKIFNGYTWEEFLKGINTVLLFWGVYALLLKESPKVDHRIYLQKGKPNYLVVGACTAYLVLAPFLFYKTDTFGVRGTITPLYEYAIIIMIVGLRFSRRNFNGVTPLLVGSCWMILHGLMHGERILALQMMIVWGLYLLLHVLSIKLVIPACFAGVFLFTIFGLYRGMASLSGNFLSRTFKVLFSGGMANDTSYFAYWASLSINRFAEATPFFERLLYMLRYIGYIFLGSVIPDANVSVLSSQANFHLGGGWLPFYLNFWLGSIGVLLGGGGLALLVNKVTGLQRKKAFRNYMAIYLVATAPRWYLYAPAPLTRGVMFYTLFYFGCAFVERWSPVVLEKLKEMLSRVAAKKKRRDEARSEQEQDSEYEPAQESALSFESEPDVEPELDWEQALDFELDPELERELELELEQELGSGSQDEPENE